MAECGMADCEMAIRNRKSANPKSLPSHTAAALAPVLEAAKNGDAHGKTARGHSRNAKSRREAETKHIVVQGARQHNLRDVDVKIDRDAMTVFCGPSGSGKSSLAMDTIYAEGQRRYVESLSSYARQFVGQMQKPAVEHIEGLSPAIAIEQRHMGHTPRSTVGTVTEIYDYFRVLFARLGQAYCPDCDIPIGTQTADEIVDKILAEPDGDESSTSWRRSKSKSANSTRRFGTTFARTVTRACASTAKTYRIDDAPAHRPSPRHDVEVVVDRAIVRARTNGRGLPKASRRRFRSGGALFTWSRTLTNRGTKPRWKIRRHSQHRVCESCGRSFEALAPHQFSFNSALGWCPACEGLGTQTGANPAALIRDGNGRSPKGRSWFGRQIAKSTSKRTTNAKAKSKSAETDRLFTAMLNALSRETGVPLDVPYYRLTTKQRRIILHGTDDSWIDVGSGQREKRSSAACPPVSFPVQRALPGARRSRPIVAVAPNATRALG